VCAFAPHGALGDRWSRRYPHGDVTIVARKRRFRPVMTLQRQPQRETTSYPRTKTSSLIRSRDARARLEQKMSETRWLVVVLLVGAVLRLFPLAFGSIPGGDGTVRLLRAIVWAQHPQWEGLSGIWPPLHWYVLGALIGVWPAPLFWARLLGLVCELGTIYLMFRSTRTLYGDTTAAGWSALLLALYWTHASLVGSNFVEVYYLFFVMLAVYWTAQATVESAAGARRFAFMSGCAIAFALFLRHEAELIWPVMLGYLWYHRRSGVAVRFAIPAAAATAWQIVEPWMAGHSYLEWTGEVVAMKALDQQLLHQSIIDALKRWVLMPASTPSFIVILCAGVGIVMKRHNILRELFLPICLVQVAVYFMMTVISDWNPQQRYLMLYLVNLLPYAGLALAALQARARWLAPLAVTGAVLVQATAWGYAYGAASPLGWLPIQQTSSSEKALERWVQSAPIGSRICEVASYSLQRRGFRTTRFPWDVNVAIAETGRSDLISGVRNPSPAELGNINRGGPLSLVDTDVVLVNPESPLYPTILSSLPPQAETEFRDRCLEIVRVHAGPLARPHETTTMGPGSVARY